MFHTFKVGDTVEAAFGPKGAPCWNGTHLQSQTVSYWREGKVLATNQHFGGHKNMILVRFKDGTAKGLDWYWNSPTEIVAGVPLGIQPGFLRLKGSTPVATNLEGKIKVQGPKVAACQKKNPLGIQKLVPKGKWISVAGQAAMAVQVEDETHGEIRRTLREWPYCPNGGEVNIRVYKQTEQRSEDGNTSPVIRMLEFEWVCSCCPVV